MEELELVMGTHLELAGGVDQSRGIAWAVCHGADSP